MSVNIKVIWCVFLSLHEQTLLTTNNIIFSPYLVSQYPIMWYRNCKYFGILFTTTDRNIFFYLVFFEYEHYHNKDCLEHMDIHSLESNENCMMWCNGNDDSGAFTNWPNTCFFKNMSCGNDIINSSNTILYVKQGRAKEELQKFLEQFLNIHLKNALILEEECSNSYDVSCSLFLQNVLHKDPELVSRSNIFLIVFPSLVTHIKHLH